ncbi:MAG: hypothetical protein QOH97_2715 [Actinoplanes sp.]|jgi:DNA-binding transcriptional regulator LsrR (DeoR family)|nr:hypothetical protein [Actinoplanes sp.]
MTKKSNDERIAAAMDKLRAKGWANDVLIAAGPKNADAILAAVTRGKRGGKR